MIETTISKDGGCFLLVWHGKLWGGVSDPGIGDSKQFAGRLTCPYRPTCYLSAFPGSSFLMIWTPEQMRVFVKAAPLPQGFGTLPKTDPPKGPSCTQLHSPVGCQRRQLRHSWHGPPTRTTAHGTWARSFQPFALEKKNVHAAKNGFSFGPRRSHSSIHSPKTRLTLLTPPLVGPGPSNEKPRPIPQGPLKSTSSGPKNHWEPSGKPYVAVGQN